jgi:PAS domain S-box-containing protein
VSIYLDPDNAPAGVLAALVDACEDAIITKDLNGIIRSWSSGAERLYGYAAHSVIGQSVALILPSDHGDELSAILERIKKGERVEHFETVRHAEDGRLIQVSLVVVPIRDPSGQIIGAMAVARDLTARKRTDAALRHS